MEDRQRNVGVTVGTTNVEISAARNLLVERRKSFTAVNNSTNGQVISITFVDEAGTSTGVPLSPGGFIVMAEDSGYIPPQGRINAISNLAGGTLAIWETIADPR